MGFNLHFSEPERQPSRKHPKRISRGVWLLAALGLCLAAALAGDLLLSSGRYGSVLIGDAGAAIAAGRANVQALVSGN